MHRKLFWFFFLVTLIAFVICVISVSKMEFSIALWSFGIAFLTGIITRIIKIDNDLRR